MAFVLTEEQNLLAQTAKQFFTEKVPVSNLRHLRDTADPNGYDPKIWEQIVELGLAAILIPEEYGGTNFGAIGMGLVMQEAGRVLAATPLYATSVLGVGLILEAGNTEQKQKYLPEIAQGKHLFALALEEYPHHNPAVALEAQKSGKNYVLNGHKCFVLDGHIADTLIVPARTRKDGITLFLTDAKSAGITRHRTSMVDSRNAANITFKNVTIPADSILGTIDGGATPLETTLDLGRIMLAAEMLGGTEAAFTTTLEYLKERKQFDAIIGSFQALQHRAAEMFCAVEIAQAVVLGATTALDERQNDVPRIASLAKARLADTTRLITNEAIQIHGGIGMTDEMDVGLYLKRARVQTQIFGDAHFHRNRYATLANY